MVIRRVSEGRSQCNDSAICGVLPWLLVLQMMWQFPIALAITQPGGAGEFSAESVVVGKGSRIYRLVVPKTVDLKRPTSLVIAFHGILIDSKDLMPRYTHLNEAAEVHKFIIAYPDAIRRSWGLVPEKVAADLTKILSFLLRSLKKIATNT